MNKPNIILTIAGKEFCEALRNKILWVFAGITWLLLILAAFAGWKRHQGTEAQREKASRLFRHEWEEQKANPHSAAHFGTYLFKPSSVLEVYDHGLNSFLGSTYRVEAHVQHDVNHSEAEHSDSVLRFGELSVSLVLQFLLPLMILLISFNTISKEREGNTLKVLMIQGGKASSVIWGKLLGIYAIVLSVAVPALLLLAIPVALNGTASEAIIRYLLFAFIYLVYFFVFTGIGIALSAISRSSQAALTTGLAVWVLLAVLIPRGTTRWIDQAYPLPSRYDFNRQISKGYSQGLGKDGGIMDRWNKYLKETLEKYNVDTVTALPVNFDGLSMQYGEDYNSRVYDHFAGQVEARIDTQQKRLEQFSLLNPFQAVQQLSMGVTGTDYFHHLAFHHQAKQYRDEFVRVLNLSLANSGSAYLSYEFQVGPDFFRRMKEFNYRSPSLKETLYYHRWALISLLAWLLVSLVVLIPLSIRQVKI